MCPCTPPPCSASEVQSPVHLTDLAPSESGDESLESDSSEGSAQQWRILLPDTETARLSSCRCRSFNITALGAGMFSSHLFTTLPCSLTLPYLLKFRIPSPDDRCFRHFQDFFLLPPRPPAGPGWPFMFPALWTSIYHAPLSFMTG